MVKHVLVTGGAGFIGSNLIREILSHGDKVWAVDNLSTGRLKNLAPFEGNAKFRFSEADLTEWDELGAAVKWADRIYHMAATVGQRRVLANPIPTISGNIRGCELILQAIHDQKAHARLLIASTSEVYCHSATDPDGKISETADLVFFSGQFVQETYPVSKLVNEIMGLSYAATSGIHCAIARLFNTIGVNQCSTYGMVVPSFIEQALANKPMTVFGDGKQSRSFSDVRDTVKALVLLLESPESNGQIVNVGHDKECSILQLAELIKKMTGSSSKIEFLSYQEAYGIDEFTDVRRRRPNLAKLAAITGFTDRYTLEDTISEILKSYS